VESPADIINHLHEVSLINFKTNDRAGNRHPRSKILHVNSRAQARPLRQLENEHGSDRGGNGEKPLRDASDEVDLVRQSEARWRAKRPRPEDRLPWARAISQVQRVVSEVRGILKFQNEGNAFSS
jgi:hypothetical protein